MKNLSLFHKFIYFLNVPLGILLLVSYLANYVNPSYISWIGLLGLGYPIWLVSNVIFFFFWLISLKKQLLFSLVCIAIGYNQFFALFQLNGKNRVFAKEEQVTKVMTYNVQTFSKNISTNWAKNAAGIRNVVTNEDPDIVCFQEFSDSKSIPSFNYRYKHIKNTSGHFGLAIMSKYKMINKGEVEYDSDEGTYKRFIYTDVIRNKDTLRIINAHLLSIGLDKQNLKDLPNSEISQQELEKQKQRLIKPLLKGYKGRGDQARKLSEFIGESPYPIILCGDFNDTPGSYAYHQVSKHLKDAFVESGQGFATTHPGFNRYHLPLRIDHIFVSENLLTYNYEVVEKQHSDHYPVVVDVKL